MRSLRLAWQGGKLAVCTVMCWLAVYGAALAQPPEKKVDPNGGSYVVSYSLVLVGVGLGMLVVFRASHRRDRAKPEVYDEQKIK